MNTKQATPETGEPEYLLQMVETRDRLTKDDWVIARLLHVIATKQPTLLNNTDVYRATFYMARKVGKDRFDKMIDQLRK